jgi:hypothetical protein
MKRLMWVISFVAFIFILLWIDVFYLMDKKVFVLSPDEVVGSFFQFLRSDHFDQARHLLCRELQQKTNAEGLKEFKEKLESRWGRIEKINDEKSESKNSRVLGVVRVKTENGEFRIDLPAVRESGLWRISGLE